MYRDIETDEMLSLEDLQNEYNELKASGNTEADTFDMYLESCLNGSLEEVK